MATSKTQAPQNNQEKINAQEREVETGKLVQTVQELQALLIA